MDATMEHRNSGGWHLPVRYPSLYLWLVFLSSLDVILTRVILFFGGIEVNPIADVIIQQFGVPGMTMFKFTIVIFVILIAEYVGSIRARLGKSLMLAAVLINCVPVCWSSGLLLNIRYEGDLLEHNVYPDEANSFDDVMSIYGR